MYSDHTNQQVQFSCSYNDGVLITKTLTLGGAEFSVVAPPCLGDLWK